MHPLRSYIQVQLIRNEQVFNNSNGFAVRFNVFPRPPTHEDYEFPHQYTANCVPILKPNIFAVNGIVLGIARELSPIKDDLWDIIKERNDLSTFKSIVENTDLVDYLEHTDAITILAPNDKAFEAASPALNRALRKGNKCALSKNTRLL